MLISHAESCSLQGKWQVPGDKSISVRAALLSPLLHGTSQIHGWLLSDDTLAAVDVMRALNAEIEIEAQDPLLNTAVLKINGQGVECLHSPSVPLFCRGSGATLRLLVGLLSGLPLKSLQIQANPQLRARPMTRIIEPLKARGAKIDFHPENPDAIITIHPNHTLLPLDYESPVASAQVKSSILLSGLFALGKTTLRESQHSRDHTERMLKTLGVDLKTTDSKIEMNPVSSQSLNAFPDHYKIPGDISSAAFFIVAATLLNGSHLILNNVGVNQTRMGIVQVLKNMGAHITLSDCVDVCSEEVATIEIKSSRLRGIEIDGSLVPSLIDEFPILAVAASQAEGMTIVKDASELKVKESNRIFSIVSNLKKMGADIEETNDGFKIFGPTPLHGAQIDSFGDHRIAMAFAVAGLIAHGETWIEDSGCVNKSYPHFFKQLALMLK